MEKIKITANGKTCEVTPGCHLSEFLKEQGLQPGKVAVEHNGNALDPDEILALTLSADDRLEIVRIVAGG